MATMHTLPQLNVQPDQTPNLLGMIAAMRQQQLMPGQLQEQQERIKGQQLANQQAQYEFQAQQALNKSYQNAVKVDGNGTPQIDGKAISDSLQASGFGSKLPGVLESINKFNKSYVDLANSKSDQQAKVADLMGNAAAAVKAGGYDPKLAHTILDAFPRSPQVDQVRMMIDGDPQAFQKEIDGLISQSPKASEAYKNREQGNNAAANAARIAAETNPDNPADPNFQKQKYQSILENLQKPGGLKNISAADYQWARAFEASQAKTTTQSDSLGVTSTNTSKPSGLATVGGRVAEPAAGGTTPAQPAAGGGSPNTPSGKVASIIDAVGQYKYNPTLLNRLLTKHPEILGQVDQKYPDFSQSNYNAINKAITDLAPSGKTGQQITSYNTFLRHAGALYDAVDSLNNSKYSDLLNKPMNWLAQHTGDPRVADFMAAMQPPMKEFQAFLLNNHAMHDEDVKDAHDLISLDKTPQEIRAVLKRFAETGSARLSEQNESFKRITGKDIPNLVSPEAAKAYNKITGNGGQGGGNVAPEGTIVQTPKGKMIKRGGQWVAY